MKNTFLLFTLGAISLLFSCNSVQEEKYTDNLNTTNSKFADTVSYQAFTTDLQLLTKDFMTWYTYTYKNVKLSENFIGIDTNMDTINKKTFLDKMIDANVAALKTNITNGQSTYQLFELNSKDESIQSSIKQMASTEMAHFKMEGTQIPDFDFTDLKGKVYTKSTTRGKIVILKCWFIHCVACVKEFPELNNLVDKYKNRTDIVFISLAFDNKKDLKKFLLEKEFKYAVIPETKNYMANKLHISEYPTHFLIDTNGKILKVVNRIEELTPFLTKQIEANPL
jgi:peroxiredoxin